MSTTGFPAPGRAYRPMKTLQDLATGRGNNFNLLRMIAATSVLISHAYPLALGPGAAEPLSSTLHVSLGELAVLTFFAISGYFISSSFVNSRGAMDFCVARGLRIYPALLLVIIMSAAILGPLFTTHALGAYAADDSTYTYLFRNLSLKWMQYDLPGVFGDNPYPSAVNGSLWSLFYEVLCYAVVALVGIWGVMRQGWRFIGFLALYAIGYLALKHAPVHHNTAIADICQLTLPFVIGMAFYRFRRVLPLHVIPCVLAGGTALLSYGGPWFEECFVLFWSYLIFCVGYWRWRPLVHYNRIGDYSYGMYIYAFPWEQICAACWKGISPLGLMALSFPPTLACAMLSWHMLERRALARRTAIADWLRGKLQRRAATCPSRRFSPGADVTQRQHHGS